MRLNFAFSNLLGTVYRGNGNVSFLPDGNTLLSPVGNKVTMFDLKNYKSETLPIETRFNICCVAINPEATNALLITESSEAMYINLHSRTILHRHRFGHVVRCAKFSPDGKRFAVCRDNDVLIIQSPGIHTHQYNPFLVEYTYRIAHDVTVCLDWSADSRLFISGSHDGSSRVCATVCHKYCNVRPINTIGGHNDRVVACWFEDIDSYDVFTIDRRGNLIRWQANIEDLLLNTEENEQQLELEMKKESNVDDKNENTDADSGTKYLKYSKVNKHNYRDAVTAGSDVKVSAVDYSRVKHLLVTGFTSGAFVLHEMPDFNLIHSLSISSSSVRSIQLNRSADWLAVACGQGAVGQLLVWEWQSETYVMKQQAHTQQLTSVSYSPDGWMLATGAEDGKVKVWSVSSGFCIVTFTEHTGCVSAVKWTQAGKAVLSASYDGTVRACDMKRYRNFRTLVTPRPAQLSCLSVDSAGEIVCAGAMDLFDVFVWSLQNGRLLEVLSAHECPVSAVAFNPVHSTLASVSWDKTLRVWDVFSGTVTSEVVQLPNDALDVFFSPDGSQVAVLTMDSQLTWFDWRQNVQTGQIEAKLDLDPGRTADDQITAQKSGTSKSFTTSCQSPDGDLVLLAGQSKFICLYHAKEHLLLKKFSVTANLSLGAVSNDVDRRKVSEYGNMQLWDVSDEDDDHDSGQRRKSKLKLPGVKNTSDFGERTSVPEIRVAAVDFCPTGRSWAAATTEGLLIYSLDNSLIFDPFQLSTDVTPASIRRLIVTGDYGRAVVDSIRLNQTAIIREAVEATPVDQGSSTKNPIVTDDADTDGVTTNARSKTTTVGQNMRA